MIPNDDTKRQWVHTVMTYWKIRAIINVTANTCGFPASYRPIAVLCNTTNKHMHHVVNVLMF